MSADNGPGISDVSAPGIDFTLARLVAGKVDAIAFVEVGPDAIAVQVLGADPHGVPVLRPEAGHSVPWAAILPGLPSSGNSRYEWLTGDIDAVPGGAAAEADVERALESLKQLAVVATSDWSPGPWGRLDIVLVNRVFPGQLLATAVARARAVLRPVCVVVAKPLARPLPDLVRALATRAPLRYGYELAVAEVDPETRAVNPRMLPLFPPGTAVSPGPSPEASITVSPVTGHAARPLSLPIVAHRGPVADLRDTDALAEYHPLVAMTGLSTRNGGSVELRVRLTEPGCPRIVPPQQGRLTDAEGPGWPELIDELPPWLPPKNLPWLLSPPGYLDLAVLVELGGLDANVAARVSLARDFVGKFRGVRDVMIATVGYRDHGVGYRYYPTADEARGKEAHALLVGCRRLVTQAEAASTLAMPGWWEATPVADPEAAPLEHALGLLADAHWGWRRRARRVVVVIGSRPPHPATTLEAERYARVPPVCKFGYRWREKISMLQKEHPVDWYTVLDQASAAGYGADIWREFGARGSFPLGRGSAGRLAQASGLTPPPRAQIRLSTPRAASSSAAGSSRRAVR